VKARTRVEGQLQITRTAIYLSKQTKNDNVLISINLGIASTYLGFEV